MELLPAYGRDYKTAKDAKAAWANGADFMVASIFGPNAGKYTSCRDFNTNQTVVLRFCRNTKITAVKGMKGKFEAEQRAKEKAEDTRKRLSNPAYALFSDVGLQLLLDENGDFR